MKNDAIPTRRGKDRIPVWIVDDNRSFCFLLSEALNQSKIVECRRFFHSCQTAIDALIKGNKGPGAILLDIKMPGMSGLQAIAKMRELSPETRIIMLTSYDADENIRIAINRGASGYLLKTSTPTEIVSAILNAEKGGAALDAMITKRMLEVYLGQNQSNPYHLTKREQDVLRCAADGLTVQAMADRLSLSFFTVENHLRSIHRKFHVHNRQSLIIKAMKERLI
jgi:DNA-binding NarL/FixJ family response regulator